MVIVFVGGLASRLVQYAVAGTLGNLVVKGAASLRPKVAPVARQAAVKATASGIVAGRRAGEAAEEARLKAGDIIAEAHASLGEESPPPSEPGTAAHDHDH